MIRNPNKRYQLVLYTTRFNRILKAPEVYASFRRGESAGRICGKAKIQRDPATGLLALDCTLFSIPRSSLLSPHSPTSLASHYLSGLGQVRLARGVPWRACAAVRTRTTRFLFACSLHSCLHTRCPTNSCCAMNMILLYER